MKIVALPIEVVSYTDHKGEVRPLRIRLQTEDHTARVIKIDKIVVKEREKLAGNVMLVFRCQSKINNLIKIFEVKYDLKTCKWMLYKI